MKIETFKALKQRIPERILEKSIKGMLPKGPLGRKMFTRLKVVQGSTHSHIAQKPELVNI
jgi:large subunit ribosomal protein L13